LEGNIRLVAGNGEYFFDGDKPIFMPNRTDMLALPGNYRYRRGITFEGRGRRSTIFTLLPGTNGDRYFYDTYDSNYPGLTVETGDTGVADFINFRGMTLRGAPGMATRAEGTKTGGFRFKTFGWEKFITWSDFDMEYLDSCFELEGYGNCDRNRLNNVRISHIRDRVFYFNNNQAVSWLLTGVDADDLHGHCIEIGPEGGGDLQWLTGTVSFYAEVDDAGVELPTQRQKAFIYWDNSGKATGATSGPGNNKYTLRQIRAEIYSDSQALVYTKRDEETSYGSLDIVFEDCPLPMAFTDAGAETRIPGYRAVRLENRTSVKFLRSQVTSSFEYECAKHDPSITFEDVEYLNEVPIADTNMLAGKCFITGGQGTITGRRIKTQRNVAIGSYNTVIAADFTKGFQGLSDIKCSVQGKDILHGWPQNGALGSIKTYFPEGSVITDILINKPAEVVATPIADYALEVQNSAAAVLLNTGGQSQNLAILKRVALADPQIIPAAPNNFFELVPKGANANVLFTNKSGGLYYEYY